MANSKGYCIPKESPIYFPPRIPALIDWTAAWLHAAGQETMMAGRNTAGQQNTKSSRLLSELKVERNDP